MTHGNNMSILLCFMSQILLYYYCFNYTIIFETDCFTVYYNNIIMRIYDNHNFVSDKVHDKLYELNNNL